MVKAERWRGRRVLVTGHTGFKGSWLCLWLHALGAHVIGYARPPAQPRSLYRQASVDDAVAVSIDGDVRSLEDLTRAIERHRPEVVFHLAAQALVRTSYRDPVETYSTNVMGTVNVLEAVRVAGHETRAVVCVTSDKCYEERVDGTPYVETDRMGGSDPYASSKGCSELVCAAYRQSFAQRPDGTHVAIASARAGNVIGGGDWARDRLVVDVVAALLDGRKPTLRFPAAVRPWQFVLDPLAGYLQLAERCLESPSLAAGGWNFGPATDDCRPVAWLTTRLSRAMGHDGSWTLTEGVQPHEAGLLLLDASKARRELEWRPVLDLSSAIDATAAWYLAYAQGDDLASVTREQLDAYRQQRADA